MLRFPRVNSFAHYLARPHARINHEALLPQLSNAWRDAVYFPVHIFLQFAICCVRVEPEGIENLLLIRAELL
jgi:hypothetical protein